MMPMHPKTTVKGSRGTEMTLELKAERGGDRIDSYLQEQTEYSRNRIQSLLKSGRITVNGVSVSKSYALRAGDRIEIEPPEIIPCDVRPEPIPLDIVYEDQDICVLNKPQGMVVHPAPGHADGTLVNALLFHLGELSSIGGVQRPGIVHRIDRMTSGLLVVAKNDAVHRALAEQFQTHEAGREYLALVDGNLREENGTVNAPIGRHPQDRKRMAIVDNGREAVTHWNVLERFRTHTLLHVALETGRTHQIRVHMASIHHPVTGDEVYGAKKAQLGLAGQALHGYRMHFLHPAKGVSMSFCVPIPDYFMSALKKLGWPHGADYFCKEDV